MRKLVSIVCESMNWNDAESIELPELQKEKFDWRGSVFSAQSLWLMQTSAPVNFHIDDCHDKSKSQVFAAGDFISNHHKTRLMANWFPWRFDTKYLDPKSKSDGEGKPVFREPEAWQYPVLLKFLAEEFYQSDYEWLIYWSSIGHSECTNCRLPGEDQGIPNNLKRTTAEWFSLIQQDIMPLIKGPVVIHGDHPTSRNPNQYTYGFVYHSPSVKVPTLTDWCGLRNAVKDYLCS